MSFGTFARKVRDPARPFALRVRALCGCLERYHPLGFETTFGYLEHLAGPLRRDESALLKAVEALSASRTVWLAEVSAYADRCRAAKRLGERAPRPAEANPHRPDRWYGDPRAGALFALDHWRSECRYRGRSDPRIDELVAAGLQTGLSAEQRATLEPLVPWRVLSHLEQARSHRVREAEVEGESRGRE